MKFVETNSFSHARMCHADFIITKETQLLLPIDALKKNSDTARSRHNTSVHKDRLIDRCALNARFGVVCLSAPFFDTAFLLLSFRLPLPLSVLIFSFFIYSFSLLFSGSVGEFHLSAPLMM